ncbi:ANTAR domain-containing response regulator [Paenibacillus beijingensis]|uniref:Fis family transcriptional regulator n=1 Tax=Paenibacillus beijingensis TaxID=1126833 RepID=A0A0D5NIW8_9BACL|nr:response regulator [Paenibacillus beijingensis]AJY75201.1 hypothetical protein VN24_12215 [Paenibacillus beijingensis]
MNRNVVVMIADDEPIVRLDLEEMLREAGYADIIHARNGEEAIRIGYERQPDLVVMDVRMPDIDGIKAAVQIGKWYDPAIVFLTSYSYKECAAEARQAGAAGFVAKPFTEATLLPAVEIALSQQLRMRELRDDVRKLKTKMEERRVIDKAKGLLMQRDGLDEETAFGELRSLSMRERTGLKQIADRIIREFEQAKGDK